MAEKRMNQQHEEKYQVAVSAESEQLIYQLMKHLRCHPTKTTTSKRRDIQYHGNLNVDGRHELEIVGIMAGNYLNLNSKTKTHYGLLVVIDCLTVTSQEELKMLLRPFLVYLKSYSCVIGLVNSDRDIKTTLTNLLQSIDVAVPVFELDYTNNNALIFLETLLYLKNPYVKAKDEPPSEQGTKT